MHKVKVKMFPSQAGLKRITVGDRMKTDVKERERKANQDELNTAE